MDETSLWCEIHFGMSNPIKTLARLRKIESFGDGVYRLLFDTDRRHTRFSPGQFLHLALDPFDPQEAYWPESRVFSICSSPRTDMISIVYSVKGPFTTRMAEELHEGKEYWLKLPFGDFIIDSRVSDSDNIVLAAGGTGISPYIPFLEREIESNSTRTIRLVYGIRTASLSIFGEAIERACSRLPNFELYLVTEDGSRLGAQCECASHLTGIITTGMLLEERSPEGNDMYFLSGPPAMIQTLSSDLIMNGIAQERIQIDDWG